MKIVKSVVHKGLFIALLLGLISQFAIAQEKTSKNKDLQIKISNLETFRFSLDYKLVKSEKFAWTFGAANLRYSVSVTNPLISSLFPHESHSISAGFETGPEFRKQINDRFMLYHGPKIHLGASISAFRVKNPSLPIEEQWDNRVVYNARVPYVIGLQYKVSDFISFAGEFTPALSFEYLPGNADVDNYSNKIIRMGLYGSNYGNISIVFHL